MRSEDLAEALPGTRSLRKVLDEITDFRPADIPRGQLPTILSELAAAQSALAAVQGALVTRITALSSERETSPPEGERWLTTDEAASLLRVDRKWLYRRAQNLPSAGDSAGRSFSSPRPGCAGGWRTGRLDGTATDDEERLRGCLPSDV